MPVELMLVLIGIVPFGVVLATDWIQTDTDEIVSRAASIENGTNDVGGDHIEDQGTGDMIADVAHLLAEEAPAQLTPGRLLEADLIEPALVRPDAGIVLEGFEPDKDVVMIDYEGQPPALEFQSILPDHGLHLGFSDGTLILLAGLTSLLPTDRIAYQPAQDETAEALRHAG